MLGVVDTCCIRLRGPLAFAFLFLFTFFSRSSFWLGLTLRFGLGLVSVVFPRSRLCLLHENDSRLLLEMSSTVTNSISCLRIRKIRSAMEQLLQILSGKLGSSE